MPVHPHEAGITPAAPPEFARIVCGVDGSLEAESAARQAALLAPGAHMTLLGVIVAGFAESVVSAVPGTAPRQEELGRETARSNLARTRTVVEEAGGTAVTTIAVGPPAAILMSEAERFHADMIVVGSHSTGRAVGVVLGSVATRLIHDAACSVLLARPTAADPYPRSIVVGVDASEWSRLALATAEGMAARLGVPLRAVHVGVEPAMPEEILAAVDDEVEHIHTRSAAAGLAACVTSADVLVVGSRGLRGLRALGSVSEAVAHRAPCSVLVVR
jgi:nucleotide-binding universal stress UspA family protein